MTTLAPTPQTYTALFDDSPFDAPLRAPNMYYAPTVSDSMLPMGYGDAKTAQAQPRADTKLSPGEVTMIIYPAGIMGAVAANVASAWYDRADPSDKDPSEKMFANLKFVQYRRGLKVDASGQNVLVLGLPEVAAQLYDAQQVMNIGAGPDSKELPQDTFAYFFPQLEVPLLVQMLASFNRELEEQRIFNQWIATIPSQVGAYDMYLYDDKLVREHMNAAARAINARGQQQARVFEEIMDVKFQRINDNYYQVGYINTPVEDTLALRYLLSTRDTATVDIVVTYYYSREITHFTGYATDSAIKTQFGYEANESTLSTIIDVKVPRLVATLPDAVTMQMPRTLQQKLGMFKVGKYHVVVFTDAEQAETVARYLMQPRGDGVVANRYPGINKYIRAAMGPNVVVVDSRISEEKKAELIAAIAQLGQ